MGIFVVAVAIFAAAGVRSGLVAQAAPPPAPLDSLDRYIERNRIAWGIPGLAVAIVRGDSVIWSRGFGVRRLGDTASVTPATVFAIGSTTKSFTAALLGFLVDEGKLRWDDRVVDRLPGFALADRASTDSVTIRDLLSHRTGLVSNNLVFWGSDVPRAEIVRRARYIPVAGPLRSRYEYQNVMFVAAGAVVEAVTGRTWEEELRRRILQPLGMSRTEPGTRGIATRSNVASPHGYVDGVLAPIPWLDLDAAGPAGSITSTALDMTRYVRWHLQSGVAGRKRLLADSTMDQMHGRQMRITRDAFYAAMFPETTGIDYGLGWMSHDYHGHRIVEHGGQTDGMNGTLAMMPELGLGVVVLTNTQLMGLPSAIALRVFDAFLGRPPRDWAALLRETTNRLNAPGSPRPVEPAHPTPAAIPVARLAARYRHPLYGELTVSVSGGTARLSLLGRTVPLRHWTGDGYRPEWKAHESMVLAMLPVAVFEAGPDGRVRRVKFGEVATFELSR